MKKILLAAAAAVTTLLSIQETRAGTFYGLWWDGSAEQFVSVDPYTASKTVIKEIPGVKYITMGSIFDPDRSRFGFVGRESGNADYYYGINAPTGDLFARIPKTDTIRSLLYSPNERMAYGLAWSDSSTRDSAGNIPPQNLAGKEYFVSIDPSTGTRANTYIPGVKFIRVGSQFLDTDSGRYVFAGIDTAGLQSYYVMNTTNGALLAQLPHTMKIDNPVYDPAIKGVHGLWWSDSSYYANYDSLGHPKGAKTLAGMEYFVTLTQDSIAYTALPDVKYITFNWTFDPDNNRYVFVGKGASGPTCYYVIDAATGSLLSQTATVEKIDNIAYARNSSTIDTSFAPVGLSAPRAAADGMTARAQSFTGFLILTLDGAESFSGKSAAFSLRDISGKVVMSRAGIRDNRVRVETRGLESGIYFYQVKRGSVLLGKGKIRVE